MTYVVGQPLRFTFDGVETGQTWEVTAAERDGVGITVTPTVTDLDDGRYRGEFTPEAAGLHAARLASDLGLVETFEWDVLTAAEADPLAAIPNGDLPGSAGYILYALFRRPIEVVE